MPWLPLAFPWEYIYTDKMSGSRTDRPGLTNLLDVAREGDTVVVVALDRLGRSMMHVIETIEVLQERKIALKSLRENIDSGEGSPVVGRQLPDASARVSSGAVRNLELRA